MPNIRSQIVGPLDSLGPTWVGEVGIHITASDGRSYTVTKSQIRNRFLGEGGTRQQRRQAVLLWLRDSVRDALGPEQIDTTQASLDFDDSDGTPTRLEVV